MSQPEFSTVPITHAEGLCVDLLSGYIHTPERHRLTDTHGGKCREDQKRNTHRTQRTLAMGTRYAPRLEKTLRT